MLRRLLACIALFTGLAAIGAPVQASVIIGTNSQLETSSQRADARRETPVCPPSSQCEQRTRGQLSTPCSDDRPVRVYIPTVQFGADRAYE